MAIPSYITDQHINLASRALSEAGTTCNSTKYFVEHFGRKVAPKKIISLAAFLACGQALPVSRFSGGRPTNNRLKRAGLTIRQFEQAEQLELDLNN